MSSPLHQIWRFIHESLKNSWKSILLLFGIRVYRRHKHPKKNQRSRRSWTQSNSHVCLKDRRIRPKSWSQEDCVQQKHPSVHPGATKTGQQWSLTIQSCVWICRQIWPKCWRRDLVTRVTNIFQVCPVPRGARDQRTWLERIKWKIHEWNSSTTWSLNHCCELQRWVRI
jgi:hypothetical protein